MSSTIIKPTAEELAAILDAHRKWLRGEAGGSRANLARANLADADLADANLADADLADANLARADLADADLADANLADANLADANLARADLADADLADANLARANLARANLARANLAGADLADANLARADLAGADLADANLARADLAGANLADANLADANLADAKLGARSIVPETGAFEGWKVLFGGHIAHLRIPADAGRVGGLVGRKCRAERAEVIAIYCRATGAPLIGPAVSTHDRTFEYRAGATVVPDTWCDDIRLECASGIHFFLTRIEAESYLY